jgi:hypothetical protein
MRSKFDSFDFLRDCHLSGNQKKLLTNTNTDSNRKSAFARNLLI